MSGALVLAAGLAQGCGDSLGPDDGGGNGGDDESSSGGAPSGSGGAATGGEASLGGGGSGPVGEKLFEALLVIVNEYDDDEDNTITAEAAFTEPDFDASSLEAKWNSEFATFATLEPGECGPLMPRPDRGMVPLLGVGLPSLLDQGDLVLNLGELFDGYYNGFLDTGVQAARDTPLDFFINGQGDIPSAVAEKWGELPSFPPPAGSDCPIAEGCSFAVPAFASGDETFIQFNGADGNVVCRGVEETVTIAPDALDNDTSAFVFLVQRHDVFLGGSPVRIVVLSRGSSFALAVGPG